jgi:hypothetical protein
MVDYQPISELVNQIPADTWEVLQEIQKRRPAMMLDELLDKRERVRKLPQYRELRLLKNHPLLQLSCDGDKRPP